MAEKTQKTLVNNRRARHDYFIEDTYEAGIVLQGSEVKSLRAGKANLQDAYCKIENNEVLLLNAHISPYEQASYFTHEPKRPRKLLLNKREINRLYRATEQKGFTLVPLRIYLAGKFIKVSLGVAKGKKLFDKRATIAENENKRQLDRLKKQFNA